mmetsp:Transcript_1327/g.2802  ORF Transcript_1327/g.2802 Transcript_1327/m.2802 type:complete len:260 (+) Transcript_1327:111-890(+)
MINTKSLERIINNTQIYHHVANQPKTKRKMDLNKDHGTCNDRRCQSCSKSHCTTRSSRRIDGVKRCFRGRGISRWSSCRYCLRRHRSSRYGDGRSSSIYLGHRRGRKRGAYCRHRRGRGAYDSFGGTTDSRLGRTHGNCHHWSRTRFRRRCSDDSGDRRHGCSGLLLLFHRRSGSSPRVLLRSLRREVGLRTLRRLQGGHTHGGHTHGHGSWTRHWFLRFLEHSIIVGLETSYFIGGVDFEDAFAFGCRESGGGEGEDG